MLNVMEDEPNSYVKGVTKERLGSGWSVVEDDVEGVVVGMWMDASVETLVLFV